ncbi:hypothetical protein TWF132_008761 [Orbilia oligospora]|nr:hypothetical protein TWF128_009557 [Orbilia oligospora]KAF3287078.1 hypothetical protein TWF132_008761 [Orbilia oligospora]
MGSIDRDTISKWMPSCGLHLSLLSPTHITLHSDSPPIFAISNPFTYSYGVYYTGAPSSQPIFQHFSIFMRISRQICKFLAQLSHRK